MCRAKPAADSCSSASHHKIQLTPGRFSFRLKLEPGVVPTTGGPGGVRHGYTTVALSRTIRCLSEVRPVGGRNTTGFVFVNHLFLSKFNIIRRVGVAAPPSGENGCFRSVLSSFQRRSSGNEPNVRLLSLPISKSEHDAGRGQRGGQQMQTLIQSAWKLS